jgi:poly(A) polymerase
MFFVGGCVRDAFMSRPVIDIDLTTDARPEAISELLTPVADTVWQVGAKFGTVGGLVNGTKVEITTYRSDVYQQGSRKPEVVFGNSLADDLKRRDFTVNAMALGVDLKDFVDPFDGLKSLEDKLLVTPIEPEKSFSDDPLRMMRAARFVSQHDFQIDPRVLAAMQAMADSITVVSAERVRDELDLILLSPNPEAGLRVLVETGLADRVLPELSGMQSTEDEHKLHKDVYQHSLQVLRHAIVLETEHEPRLQPDLILRLAALLHDIAKPATKKVSKSGQVTFHHHEVVGARMARNRLKALRYPNDVIEKVSRLVELHLRFHGYADGDWTDSAVRRYVRDADDLLIHLHKLTRADCTTRNKRKALDLQKTYSELEKRIGVLAAEEELAAIRPDLNGSQIMEILSIPPGREVGNAYEYMLELRLERGPMSFEDARDALLDWWRKR